MTPPPPGRLVVSGSATSRRHVGIPYPHQDVATARRLGLVAAAFTGTCVLAVLVAPWVWPRLVALGCVFVGLLATGAAASEINQLTICPAAYSGEMHHGPRCPKCGAPGVVQPSGRVRRHRIPRGVTPSHRTLASRVPRLHLPRTRTSLGSHRPRPHPTRLRLPLPSWRPRHALGAVRAARAGVSPPRLPPRPRLQMRPRLPHLDLSRFSLVVPASPPPGEPEPDAKAEPDARAEPESQGRAVTPAPVSGGDADEDPGSNVGAHGFDTSVEYVRVLPKGWVPEPTGRVEPEPVSDPEPEPVSDPEPVPDVEQEPERNWGPDPQPNWGINPAMDPHGDVDLDSDVDEDRPRVPDGDPDPDVVAGAYDESVEYVRVLPAGWVPGTPLPSSPEAPSSDG